MNLFNKQLKKLSLLIQRERHYYKIMNCEDLLPSAKKVYGMTTLERDAFKKSIKIPKLNVEINKVNYVMQLIKKLILKMEHLKPVVDNMEEEGKRKISLHPVAVKSWLDLPIDELKKINIDESSFIWDELELNYENYKVDEIFKAVLPLDQEGVASFSRIGHIVHVNLRDHLLPFKYLIGEVLKDKIAGCRTVVNKAQTIDNTYRNFQMELLCGSADYQTVVKENGINFEFDFSTVYWNSRLASEHERIVKLLKPGDVFYDVFAGVGPFSVPISKKKCQTLANDLNPESYKWLVHNAKRNKIRDNYFKAFNKDGREFITTDLKEDLIKRWHSCEENNYNIHIAMNLPAMAVEFLDAFVGLLVGNVFRENIKKNYPLVHVYCFIKSPDDKVDLAKRLVEDNLGSKLKENLEGIYFVRNVAPNKDMMRVSFYLTDDILFIDKRKRSVTEDDDGEQKCPKKLCT